MINNIKGFTLIEVAIVLIIIGFLLGGLLPALATQTENMRRSQVKNQLMEIRRALIGFALSNRRLPCPDCRSGASDCNAGLRNDGLEDMNDANCRVNYGNLPWNTLGISQATSDPWGTRFGYYVHSSYDGNPPLTLSPATPANITVRDSLRNNILANNAIAVVLSYGSNQAGGTSISAAPGSTGTIAGSPAAGADEIENNDADANFVSGDHSDANSSNGQFDDFVIWLSPNVFNFHMVQAGQLP